MNQKFLLVAISMLMVSAVYGRQISEQSAKDLALDFCNSNSVGLKISPAVPSEMKLVHKQMSGDNVDLFVFNRGESDGFVIVSGDDVATPILGYSATGSFSSDNIPPSLKGWLEEYARQIEYARQNGITYAAPEAAEDFAPINPLITSLWEQADPYNRKCPEYRGERCLTGCSATAMAMVMKHYEYPAQGTGTHSYTPVNNRRLGVLTVDFGSTTYDWENMRDDYWWGNYTDEEADAVATLMYHCGVSVDMQYDPAASGAYSKDWMVALKKYFGYDDGVHLLYREYYSVEGWNEVVYNELAAGRPVLYAGSSPYGGHAFVCDGYSSDGYFHINWGWAGMSDGYFLLSALDPYEMGSGGSYGGFNFNQTITIGIKPDDGIVDNTYPRLLMAGDFSFVGNEGAYDWFSGENDPNGNEGVMNLSGEDAEVAVGVKVVNTETGEEHISALASDTMQSMTAFGFAVDMDTLNLIDGDYKVYPVCQYSGNEDWQVIPVRYKFQQYVNLNVTDGIRTYSNADGVKHFEIEVVELRRKSEFYENEVAEFSAIVQNKDNVEVSEKIYFRWFVEATGEEVYFGGGNWARPYIGSVDEVTYYISYMPLEAGNYHMKFYDSVGNVISDTYLIEVKKGAEIELTECDYTEVVYAERSFNINGIFTNIGERDFSGTIVFRMVDDEGTVGITRNVGTYQLAVGGTSEFELNFDNIEGLEAGREYTILLSVAYGRVYKDICEPMTFTVSDDSSVAINVADDEPVEYYNLQGIRIASPENGLFIRRQGNKVEKIVL